MDIMRIINFVKITILHVWTCNKVFSDDFPHYTTCKNNKTLIIDTKECNETILQIIKMKLKINVINIIQIVKVVQKEIKMEIIIVYHVMKIQNIII